MIAIPCSLRHLPTGKVRQGEEEGNIAWITRSGVNCPAAGTPIRARVRALSSAPPPR